MFSFVQKVRDIFYLLTVRKPSNHNVGSGPMEKINRNIVEATNVRIPDSRGSVRTITADDNITVQMRADKCELNSKRRKVSVLIW